MRVLVTGGAKRIGAAISRAFGTAGWHVVIHYGRSADAAEALAIDLHRVLDRDAAARLLANKGVTLQWISWDQRGTANPDAVLNGIAWDGKSQRLFVTGKLWPKLFEIELVPLKK